MKTAIVTAMAVMKGENYSVSLLSETLLSPGELVGADEQHVAARDELRVFLDEDFSRRAEDEITQAPQATCCLDLATTSFRFKSSD